MPSMNLPPSLCLTKTHLAFPTQKGPFQNWGGVPTIHQKLNGTLQTDPKSKLLEPLDTQV